MRTTGKNWVNAEWTRTIHGFATRSQVKQDTSSALEASFLNPEQKATIQSLPNNTKFPICYERKPRAVVGRFAPSSPLESIDDGDACPFTVHNIDDLFEDDKVSQGGPGTCEASPTITSHHQCPAVPATILLLLTKWSTL